MGKLVVSNPSKAVPREYSAKAIDRLWADAGRVTRREAGTVSRRRARTQSAESARKAKPDPSI